MLHFSRKERPVVVLLSKAAPGWRESLWTPCDLHDFIFVYLLSFTSKDQNSSCDLHTASSHPTLLAFCTEKQDAQSLAEMMRRSLIFISCLPHCWHKEQRGSGQTLLWSWSWEIRLRWNVKSLIFHSLRTRWWLRCLFFYFSISSVCVPWSFIQIVRLLGYLICSSVIF